MKKLLYFMGIFIFLFLSCENFNLPKKTKQSYQPRTNNTNPTTPQYNYSQPDPATIIYVVAGTVKNEIEAIQAVTKFRNFNFESNIFRAPSGVYIITVGQYTDYADARNFMETQVQAGKIPDHAKLAYNRGWTGPVYASTDQTTSSQNPTEPSNTYSDQGNLYDNTGGQPGTYYNPNANNTPGTYTNPNTYTQPNTYDPNYRTQTPGYDPNRSITPGQTPGSTTGSMTGLFYVVIADSPDEDRAILVANRYIEQGLVVFVYETTQGYKITVGKALAQEKAETVRQSLMRQQSVNSQIVPDDNSWKRLVYP